MKRTHFKVGLKMFGAGFLALLSIFTVVSQCFAARKRPCCQVVYLGPKDKEGLPVRMSELMAGGLPSTNQAFEIADYDCVPREGAACLEPGETCEFFYNSSSELKCKGIKTK